MSYTVKQIANLTGATCIGNENFNIDWILVDSRSLCFPEDTLFFALKTKQNDGHKYIPELYNRGVRAFVVNEYPKSLDKMPEASF